MGGGRIERVRALYHEGMAIKYRGGDEGGTALAPETPRRRWEDIKTREKQAENSERRGLAAVKPNASAPRATEPQASAEMPQSAGLQRRDGSSRPAGVLPEDDLQLAEGVPFGLVLARELVEQGRDPVWRTLPLLFGDAVDGGQVLQTVLCRAPGAGGGRGRGVCSWDLRAREEDHARLRANCADSGLRPAGPGGH